MGRFFTNVQVHTAGSPREEVLRQVTEALRRWILDDAFEEVEAERADRTVLVSAGPGPWVSVYDELTEKQHLGMLTDLACLVSGSLGRTAVAILVHDSDVVELRLCREGAQVDAYSSDPGYFKPAMPAERRALFGRPGLWRDLLAPGSSVEDLRKAWKVKNVFAEEVLESICQVLGLAPAQAIVGFRELSGARELDPSRFTRLSFRSAKDPTSAVSASGPPVLDWGAWFGDLVQIEAGEPITHHFFFALRNTGSASRGLEVLLSGGAIDHDLIRPVSLAIGNSWDKAHHISFAPISDGAQSAYVARAGEVELAAGRIRSPNVAEELVLLEYLESLESKDTKAEESIRTLRRKLEHVSPARMSVAMQESDRSAEADFEGMVKAWVQGTAGAVGEDMLHVRVAPHGNPNEGSITHSALVRVIARQRDLEP